MKNTEKKPSLLEIMCRYEEDDMTYKRADIAEIRAAIEAGADSEVHRFFYNLPAAPARRCTVRRFKRGGRG